jgi:hypothetical protein
LCSVRFGSDFWQIRKKKNKLAYLQQEKPVLRIRIRKNPAPDLYFNLKRIIQRKISNFTIVILNYDFEIPEKILKIRKEEYRYIFRVGIRTF